MSAVRHHPPEELLIDYAGGGATEGEMAIIAAHLAACPVCRKTISLCETLGGALLEDLEPALLPSDLLERTLRVLSNDIEDERPARKANGLPLFLPSRVRPDFDRLAWRGIGRRGVYRIPGYPDAEPLWLYRAGPGQPGLGHRHLGDEWAVVLEGGYSDDRGAYAKGDFIIAPAGTEHLPVADSAEGCVCLFMLQGPLHFTNPAVRLLARLFG